MTQSTDIPRDEIEALLVFLANDTLTGDERRTVEEAVAADPELQTQLEALKSMRHQMQSDDFGPSPGELGLARLMRDVDAEMTPPAANTPAPPRFWKIAAMLVAGLFVAQTAFYSTTGKDDFTLAEGEIVVNAAHTIRIAFSPDVSEAQIRTLLLEQNLTIVDGPSALGLYTVAATDEAARDAALEVLQTVPQIVESAE